MVTYWTYRVWVIVSTVLLGLIMGLLMMADPRAVQGVGAVVVGMQLVALGGIIGTALTEADWAKHPVSEEGDQNDNR